MHKTPGKGVAHPHLHLQLQVSSAHHQPSWADLCSKTPKPPGFFLPKCVYPQIFPLCSLCCHPRSPPAPESGARTFSTAKPCVPAHRRSFSPPPRWVWGFGSFPPGILPDKRPEWEQGSLSASPSWLHGQLLEGAVVTHRAAPPCTALIETSCIGISALWGPSAGHRVGRQS